MEQCFHTNKEVEEFQKFHINRQNQKSTNKYSNVVAKVNTSFQGGTQASCVRDANSNKGNEIAEKESLRKRSTPTLSKKNLVPAKKPLNLLTNKLVSKEKRKESTDIKNTTQTSKIKVKSDPNFVHKTGKEEEKAPLPASTRYKNQGIQTLEEKYLDQLYAEGVIRYPSKDKDKKNSEEQKENEFGKSTNRCSNPTDIRDAGSRRNTQSNDSKSLELPEINEGVDITTKSKKVHNSVASKIAIQLNNGIVPPNYRKGVVPKYIKNRKETLQKEEEAKAAAFHPDCPEGHVPLPDKERQETLRMLKKNYQDYVNELNTMPIKTDTLRAQKRKMEIEKQLNKLEEGIKIFSRPKVFVKINA